MSRNQLEEISHWPTCPDGERGQLVKGRRRAWELGKYTANDYQGHKRGEAPKLFESYTAARKVLEQTPAATALVRRSLQAWAGLVLGDEAVPSPVPVDEKDQALEEEVRAILRDSRFAEWALPSVMTSLIDADGGLRPVRWPEAEDGPEEIAMEVYSALEFEPVYPRSMHRMSRAYTFSFDGTHKVEMTRDVIRSAKVGVDPDTGEAIVSGDVVETPHNLGVVPFVHVRTLWLGDTVWSEWAGTAVEPLQRNVDRNLAQIAAIATRAADPTAVLRGVAGEGDVGIGGNSKVLYLPDPQMDAKFLELAQGGVLRDLREEVNSEIELAARVDPALAILMPGANTSGTAWQFRTLGLPQMVAMLRGNIGGAWRRAIGMYRAMVRGEAFDPAWVESWRWRWPESRMQSSDMVRAATEAHGAGVISRTESRAFMREQGVLLPGFPIDTPPDPADPVEVVEETDQSEE